MARSNQSQRDHSLRERALKLFPWICAHCGREDSILSLMTAYRQDPYPGKVDLTVGVYRDRSGEVRR